MATLEKGMDAIERVLAKHKTDGHLMGKACVAYF
jgi:hypothetical protein